MGDQLALDGVGPDEPDARTVIAELADAGHTSTSIAAALNARGVPTPSGRGRWWASTVEHYRNPSAWAEYVRRYRRG